MKQKRLISLLMGVTLFVTQGTALDGVAYAAEEIGVEEELLTGEQILKGDSKPDTHDDNSIASEVESNEENDVQENENALKETDDDADIKPNGPQEEVEGGDTDEPVEISIEENNVAGDESLEEITDTLTANPEQVDNILEEDDSTLPEDENITLNASAETIEKTSEGYLVELIDESDAGMQELSDDPFTLLYYLDGNNAVIAGFKGKPGSDLVIPSKIDGHFVTEISDMAIGSTDLVWGDDDYFNGKLVLPDSIQAIGAYAFWGCDFKGKLELPDLLKYLGKGAFNSCDKFSGTLNIPLEITNIPEAVFYDTGFSDVIIPNSVKSIGDRAFASMELTGNLSIPGSVETIGVRAFASSEISGSVVFGEGVQSIGENAFEKCNKSYKSLSFTFPSTLKSIGAYAFWDTYFDGDIILPDGFETIGEYAFAGGSRPVAKIVIPGTVKSIPRYAFSGCGNSNARDHIVLIKEGVEKLEKDAMINCLFGEVYLPASITEMSGDQFWEDSVYNCVEGSYAYQWATESGYRIKTHKSDAVIVIDDGTTLEYQLNGGENSQFNPTLVKQGSTITLAAATKVGFSFAGWYSDAKFKKKITKITGKKGTSYTLYAKWAPGKYSVIYDGNGATSGKTKNSTFTYDAKNKFAASGYKRTGYTFAGWSTSSDGTDEIFQPKTYVSYNFSDCTEPATVYAQWTPISYWITFKSPDKKQKMADVKVLYNQEYTLPQNSFEKLGYTFAGWTDSKKKTYADCESIKNLSALNNAKYTLTPTWTYQVYYNANGGTGEMEPSTFAFNKSEKLAANSFERAGYTFSGWNASHNKKTYKAKASVKNFVASDGSNIVLSAQWKPIQYTAYFHPNTGNAKYDNASKNTKTVKNVKYDTEFEIPKCTATKAGYTFIGWNSSIDGSGSTLLSGTKGKNLTSDGARVDYYAIWEKNEDYVFVNEINFSTDTLTLDLNETYDLYSELSVSVLPDNATNKTLEWKSSNPEVATVDGTGKITAKGEGEAVIIAYADSAMRTIIGSSISTINKSVAIVVDDNAQGEEIARLADSWVHYVKYGRNVIREKMTYQEVILDCIGFVIFIYAQNGYERVNEIPWGTDDVTAKYANSLTELEMNELHSGDYSKLKEGDVLMFTGHCGIYVGNGQMVHSSYSKDFIGGEIRSDLTNGRIGEAFDTRLVGQYSTVKCGDIIKVIRFY